jgi:glucokinase
MHGLGIDIGGTKIAAGVVDVDGRIIVECDVPTPSTPEGIDLAIAQLHRELSAEAPVARIGIAAAGLVSSDRSTVMFAPNIAWRSYPIAANIRRLVGGGIPVVVENDANAAGWAEHRFGAGGGLDMLMLTVGTGVGGAAITDGRLLRGAFGAGAEVGHVQVVDGGELCGCGQRGCLEAYGSGTALERYARGAIADGGARADRLRELARSAGAVRGPHVAAAAADGDPLALELLARLGAWVGRGAATLAAVLDPAVIVVGGGVASVGRPFLEPMRVAFESHLTGRDNRPVAQVVPARLGNSAGLVGAADLAAAALGAPARVGTTS